MSNDYAIGKSTAVSNQQSITSDVTPTPGKSTLTERMVGGPAQTHEFKLTSQERARLETDLGDRMGRAFTCFHAAANQVLSEYKVELRAKAAELPVVESLFVAALGAAGGIAVKMLTPRLVGELTHLMKYPGELPEASLEMFASPVDVGKDAAKTGLAPTVDDKGTGFIDAIVAAGAARSQQLDEHARRTASDSQLATLVAAYDTRFQTTPMYREQIESRLKRFLSSHASSIGREFNNEKRVGWIGKKGGRLAYVGQSFNGTDTAMIDHRPVYNGEGALSLGDESTPDAWDTHTMQQATTHAAPSTSVYFIGFVEPDMIEPAIASHESKWQAEPEVYPWSIITGGAR